MRPSPRYYVYQHIVIPRLRYDVQARLGLRLLVGLGLGIRYIGILL